MIGVIDGGVGGLRVVAALMKRLPEVDIVYYADTLRAPYGNRSAAAVLGGSIEAAERVRRSGARVLVAASHTISAVAFDALRRRFGDAFFDAATTAAQMAVESSRRQRIGLVASRATAASRRYEEWIRERCPQAEIFAVACPLWAPLIEDGWQKRSETALIVKRGVRAIKLRRVDTLILGSNTFAVLQSVIQRKVGSHVILVEASDRLASRVAEFLRMPASASGAARGRRKVRLLVSDLTAQVARSARMFMGRHVELERAV